MKHVRHCGDDPAEYLVGIEFAGQGSADLLEPLRFLPSSVELGELHRIVDGDRRDAGDSLDHVEVVLRVRVLFVALGAYRPDQPAVMHERSVDRRKGGVALVVPERHERTVAEVLVDDGRFLGGDDLRVRATVGDIDVTSFPAIGVVHDPRQVATRIVHREVESGRLHCLGGFPIDRLVQLVWTELGA
jgi:hypothetical protein